MADLVSSHPSSSAGDVDRALKTEADDHRDSSSLGLSSSPHISPPPPEQTMPRTQHPQVRPSMANGTRGVAENARRTQEKSEKRPSKAMSIQELVDGPFTRFGTQSEIVLPFQERVAQEDSSRKDLTERLLLLLLETHAWMAARPRREKMHEVEKLEEHVKNTTEIEEQQGRSSSPASASSAYSCSTATSVFTNYEPEIRALNEHNTALAGVYHPLDRLLALFFCSALGYLLVSLSINLELTAINLEH